MKNEDAVSDLERLWVHPWTNSGNDTTGFVPRDDRRILVDTARSKIFESERTDHVCRFGSIEMQIATAHARCLHFDDRLSRSRDRILEVEDFELTIPSKNNAAHSSSPTNRAARPISV